MQVTYIGPHEAVLVPDDSVPGGEIVVAHGETVDLPSDLAEGLLEQGTDSAASPRHQRQWKKQAAKKTAPAEKGETA